MQVILNQESHFHNKKNITLMKQNNLFQTSNSFVMKVNIVHVYIAYLDLSCATQSVDREYISTFT